MPFTPLRVGVGADAGRVGTTVATCAVERGRCSGAISGTATRGTGGGVGDAKDAGEAIGGADGMEGGAMASLTDWPLTAGAESLGNFSCDVASDCDVGRRGAEEGAEAPATRVAMGSAAGTCGVEAVGGCVKSEPTATSVVAAPGLGAFGLNRAVNAAIDAKSATVPAAATHGQRFFSR